MVLFTKNLTIWHNAPDPDTHDDDDDDDDDVDEISISILFLCCLIINFE